MAKREPAVKDKAEIYCPACEWRPGPEDRWECVPSCATVWNTFWTRGVCPGCSYKWTKTQCLACGEVSPHEAWYHYPPESNELASEKALTTNSAA
jgi:hypothetical protein